MKTCRAGKILFIFELTPFDVITRKVFHLVLQFLKNRKNNILFIYIYPLYQSLPFTQSVQIIFVGKFIIVIRVDMNTDKPMVPQFFLVEFFPYEETQPLVERGLIRIVGTERVRYDGNKTAAYADEEEDIAEEVALSEDTGDRRASVSASEADALMADEAAEAQIEEGVRYADKTKTGIINVDTLGKVFAEGEKVTLEEIKKRVPFIHKKTTYIKVLARGELNKALVIEADDYSVEAVKMILLTGGKVIRTRRRK